VASELFRFLDSRNLLPPCGKTLGHQPSLTSREGR
jgi:hypothetical protein